MYHTWRELNRVEEKTENAEAEAAVNRSYRPKWTYIDRKVEP
jgi:hypothetical protein